MKNGWEACLREGGGEGSYVFLDQEYNKITDSGFSGNFSFAKKRKPSSLSNSYSRQANRRIYTTQGALAENAADTVNKPVRTAVFRKYAAPVKASLELSLLVMLACVATLPWRAGLLFVLATLLGMSYSAPILPGKRSPRSLPYSKGIFCAVISTIVTILVPAVTVGASAAQTTALVAHTATRGLAYEILQDLGDIDGDKEDGMRTLPVVLGMIGSCAVVSTLATVCGAAALAVNAPGLLVVPAVFFALIVLLSLTDTECYKKVSFQVLSSIPLLVLVSLLLSAY